MLLNILLSILIVVGAVMTGVILLQQSEGGGLVSGGSGNLMTARGAGNLLTRTTQILAGIFFVLALLITILTGRASGSSDITHALQQKGEDSSLLQKKPIAPLPLPTSTLPTTAPTAPGTPAPTGLPTSSFPGAPSK